MAEVNMTQAAGERQSQSQSQNTSLTSLPPQPGTRISRFEQVVANNEPVLESLVAQLPTESILNLYHSSRFLKSLFQQSPISWKYMSWRLHQPSPTPAHTPPATAGSQSRQSSNYALDQLLITRLTSLVLDNTAVSGATLFQTVMILRKDTLEHVSVRGCKNVSLKYHINPWLTMHAMAMQQPRSAKPPELQKLALKSLYTYRCRHHRRRPYLPSSLNRKESDSEPTHELVLTCHKLGIWTDTAWCTTPGARCFRRRGYVTMRVQQDPREVWVVYDRLWRSRNWLGSAPGTMPTTRPRKRKRDGRAWEEEIAVNGEPVGLAPEGKDVPVHLRRSHYQFVENIHCSNCATEILERCEQCSVMMHCSGCRKTLCASCAFDRPYLRNQNATEEEKRKFWWAPGCAVSPCSMQDTDPAAPGAPNQQNTLPNTKFKWCCTEPVFSGGGGITFGTAPQNQDVDRLRAAPLPPNNGYEDTEFSFNEFGDSTELIGSPLVRSNVTGPGGRWASLADMFLHGAQVGMHEDNDSIPRMLCDSCYNSDQWKIKCKACAVPLCLKHDVKEKQRVRICGYKELGVEKQELIARLKATKLFKTLWLKRKEQQKQEANKQRKSEAQRIMEEAQLALAANVLLEETRPKVNGIPQLSPSLFPLDRPVTSTLPIRVAEQVLNPEVEPIGRPLSPGSNSTGPLSRASSPAPSARSATGTPEPSKAAESTEQQQILPSDWKGCQAFFCASTRSQGDHRRRCSAVMRQCQDCKVFVCDDCVTGFDKSCPCSGCRLPEGETDSISGGTAAFYCPNCRHDRIVSRKCKRHLTCLSRSKMARVQKERKHRQRQKMTPEQRIGHIADVLLDQPHLGGFGDADFTLDTFYNSIDQELQELQEISLSAVNVVRRVQNLRSQAPPGSPAALALPNIIIEGMESDSSNAQE
ncbi:hypothetical protein LTS08_002533 [Lithohypha guttulata]|uniref:Uncharacterized protein n=1 Tax=Lithohypha guttulata TaxID=1690604 RepID=A0AAN7T6H8_9EURO|nr:hypothetical protein LTR05_000733 [Lithohypha guttulata]KAK5104642.1 hypothetical protein LTS08_002533 [Lithohypha guttulata]